MGCGATVAPRDVYKEVTHEPSATAPSQPRAPPAPPPLAALPSLVSESSIRQTLSQSTQDLVALLEQGPSAAQQEDLGTIASDEEAEAAWEGVQEVVLCYSPDGGGIDADTPFEQDDHFYSGVAGQGAPSGDDLSGPPLNTASAYGMLLSWLHQRGELSPARGCIIDPLRLLEVKDRALQFAELDGLLASPFDASVELHRQLAFSVYAKFMRLRDAGSRPQSCPRFGPHWEEMGFQGQDFATDLRGVGVLGLQHLLSFFGSFPKTARSLFACNAQREGRYGDNGAVPVACASLNFSSLAILALRDGRLSAICRQAKSVHGAVLKVHAALMSAFVHEFCSRPDATVLVFGEILQQLKRQVHAAPSKLLKELLERAPAAERSAAARFLMVRPLPLERCAPQPPAVELSAGEALEAVKLASSRRSGAAGAEAAVEPPAYRPSMLARASSRSLPAEVEAVFREVCRSAKDAPAADLRATSEDLRFFLCEALGCQASEAERFTQRVDGNVDGQVDLEEFRRGFRLLNSHRISRRERESFVRRPGSIRGEQFALEELRGCEVHVFDHVASCTVDGCSACEVLVGPSEASVFVRDCEDCSFYLAAQQLRTRRCKNCSFFLFSATEPIIEMSSGLRFAPLALAYPGLAEQMDQAGLDPGKNFWNAVFDFSSPDDCHRNWSLAALAECRQYRFLLEDLGSGQAASLSDSDAALFPAVTREQLAAEPARSGLDPGLRIDGSLS